MLSQLFVSSGAAFILSGLFLCEDGNGRAVPLLIGAGFVLLGFVLSLPK